MKTTTSRSQAIVKSGALFIATNFLLAAINITVGVLSNSLAIISDAAHSFIDAISGLIIIVSERLAVHKSNYRDKIERVTTIIIAIIIIFMGVHLIIESIEKIIEPFWVKYDTPTLIVLVSSIILKLVLALYLKKQGKIHKSTVLVASGAETMNDAWISVAVLTSAIVYVIWHVDIEAYISIVISVLIIKIGLEFIFPHLSHHHHHPLEQNPDHDHCGK
ncbi:cation diffusion facilitator family transporter [Candidatus Saccharibacteria bacterium]|nr:cation diffusion facilitator family transporter [Candidatus Saccharibacteria bacterium]